MTLKVATELELSFREQAFRLKAPKFLNFSDHLRIYHFFLCILVKKFRQGFVYTPDFEVRFSNAIWQHACLPEDALIFDFGQIFEFVESIVAMLRSFSQPALPAKGYLKGSY
jgi:hypothetical protein